MIQDNYPDGIRHLLFHTTPGQVLLISLVVYWYVQYTLLKRDIERFGGRRER